MRTAEVLLETADEVFLPVHLTSPELECLVRGIRILQGRGKEPPYTLLIRLNEKEEEVLIEDAFTLVWKRE